MRFVTCLISAAVLAIACGDDSDDGSRDAGLRGVDEGDGGAMVDAGRDAGEDAGPGDAQVADASEPVADASEPDTSTGDPCDVCTAEATCTEDGATATCTCPAGYEGDGTEDGTGCTDIDECADEALHGCVGQAEGGNCTNTAGGYECGCADGYEGDGTQDGTGCSDVDECADEALNDCLDQAQHGTCTNTTGGYACGCADGYEGDGTEGGTGCSDVDECATGTHDCGVDTCVNSLGSFACHALLAAHPFDPFLVRLDVQTGAIVARTRFGDDIGAITRVLDLDTHPATGDIYGIARLSGVVGRVLFRMDPATRALTLIGNLGDNFSSLAFTDAGVLYGVTGDGASAAETLYTIDTTTAAPTLQVALGNGADGEVIAWHPDDGLLYHWSGTSVVMESIDPANAFATTNIPVTGDVTGEVFGAVYNPFTGDLLATTLSNRLAHLTTAGAFTNIGSPLDIDLRGLTFTTRALRQTISPASGPEAGGTTVRLHSWDIGDGGTTSVFFGPNAATDLTIVDDDTITVTAPPGTGTVRVSVIGTFTRAVFSYQYAP